MLEAPAPGLAPCPEMSTSALLSIVIGPFATSASALLPLPVVIVRLPVMSKLAARNTPTPLVDANVAPLGTLEPSVASVPLSVTAPPVGSRSPAVTAPPAGEMTPQCAPPEASQPHAHAIVVGVAPSPLHISSVMPSARHVSPCAVHGPT